MKLEIFDNILWITSDIRTQYGIGKSGIMSKFDVDDLKHFIDCL